MNVNTKLPAVPLPATALDFANAYKLKNTGTLNDQVEQVVRVLIDVPAFRTLIDAVYDEDSVEGKMYLDDAAAANMIRDYAKENNGPALLMQAKLVTLVRAMKVVLRRFSAGREDRRGVAAPTEE